MRYKGRVTEWNDERGFGFVTPMSKGDRVFIHIKSFARGQQRPIGGEMVIYEMTRDSQGRPQGMNVTFSGRRAIPVTTPGPGVASLMFAACILVVAMVAVASRQLPGMVLVFYLAGSGIAYLAYAWDKSAAINGRRRTPESTLHLLGVLGGWPGALVAQKVLRHKSSKVEFRRVFWATVVLNCIALVVIFVNSKMGLFSGVASG